MKTIILVSLALLGAVSVMGDIVNVTFGPAFGGLPDQLSTLPLTLSGVSTDAIKDVTDNATFTVPEAVNISGLAFVSKTNYSSGLGTATLRYDSSTAGIALGSALGTGSFLGDGVGDFNLNLSFSASSHPGAPPFVPDSNGHVFGTFLLLEPDTGFIKVSFASMSSSLSNQLHISAPPVNGNLSLTFSGFLDLVLLSPGAYRVTGFGGTAGSNNDSGSILNLFAPSATPEPATVVMTLSGLLFFALARRRSGAR